MTILKNYWYARKYSPLFISIGVGLSIFILVIPFFLVNLAQTVKRAETRVVESEIERTENLIQHEVDHTSLSLGDWSNWNDTYWFARGGNPTYIGDNLADETFVNLNINIFLVLDTNQQIIYQKYFDNATQTSQPLPFDAAALIQQYSMLLESDPLGRQGLLDFQDYPMIISSKPILDSNGNGPSAGTLIFIRLLDQYEMEDISSLVLRKVSLSSPEQLLDEKIGLPGPSVLLDNVYTHVVDTDTVLGFKYLNDLEGQPTLLLQLESPRDFFRQGNQQAIMVLVILLMMDLLICAIVYFLTNSIITSLTHKKDEEIALQHLEESRQNALELERRVDERTRELEAKNKDLETFNYSVSHDLKAPLRAISGFSSLLENEYAHHLDETGSKYLRNIVDSTERMNMLIEDFLAYSKISKIDFSRSDFDLSKCLESIEKDYANEISTRKIDISKKLEVANFITDKDAMSMVLRNLIDNAIKFTSRQTEPRIVIQSNCINQHILIKISDNGIGFDMKYNDKIFEIFQRTHLPGEFPGTGIGLALVKRAVEKLGGAIQTQSKEGEGSTFTLMLPNHTCEQ